MLKLIKKNPTSVSQSDKKKNNPRIEEIKKTLESTQTKPTIFTHSAKTSLLFRTSFSGPIAISLFKPSLSSTLIKPLNNFQEICNFIIEGNKDEIIKNFTQKEININSRDHHNNSFLHYATKNHKLDIIVFLIQNGADVNAQDENGQTPLHLAAFNGSQEESAILMTKELIKNGAKTNIKNKYGETPITTARKNSYKELVTVLAETNVVTDEDFIYLNTPVGDSPKQFL